MLATRDTRGERVALDGARWKHAVHDEVVVGDVASPVAASPSAAGVISPGSVFAYGGEAPAGFEPLAVAASHGYAQLAADLVADGFPEYGYAETGALIAATDAPVPGRSGPAERTVR